MEDLAPVTDAPTTPRPDGLPSRRTTRARPAAKGRGVGSGEAADTPGAASPAEPAPLDLARRIVELAEDKKAADIVLLDLAGLTAVADAFVICNGGSERQLD